MDTLKMKIWNEVINKVYKEVNTSRFNLINYRNTGNGYFLIGLKDCIFDKFKKDK